MSNSNSIDAIVMVNLNQTLSYNNRFSYQSEPLQHTNQDLTIQYIGFTCQHQLPQHSNPNFTMQYIEFIMPNQTTRIIKFKLHHTMHWIYMPTSTTTTYKFKPHCSIHFIEFIYCNGIFLLEKIASKTNKYPPIINNIQA